MSLTSFISGAATELTDFVSDFIDLDFFADAATNDFVGDILSGSITSAAIAGISGGDIGEAALYGGLGSAIGSDSTFLADSGFDVGGLLNGYNKELGGALSGYGVGGGMGALGGALAAYSSKNDMFSGKDMTENEKQEALLEQAKQEDIANQQKVSPLNPTKAGGGGQINQWLIDKGLMTENGDGTVLGKGLAGLAVAGASQISQQELLDRQQEIQQENYQKRADIDYQAEQNRMGAFTNGAPRFRITR